jgi:carboxyl-terminal processing protease
MQDRGRAVLLGQTSYGKGSVQTIRPIDDAAFKLTLWKYYLPSGRFIDKVGVSPDIELQPPELDDDQQETYIELLSAQEVVDWARDNADASDQEVNDFVAKLQVEGFDLPERWIRRVVHEELNRQNNVIVPYDLDFDTVLQEAVRMLREGEISAP